MLDDIIISSYFKLTCLYLINQVSNELAITLCQIILDKNDAGEHFPLLAICLGFELVAMAVSKVT